MLKKKNRYENVLIYVKSSNEGEDASVILKKLYEIILKDRKGEF